MVISNLANSKHSQVETAEDRGMFNLRLRRALKQQLRPLMVPIKVERPSRFSSTQRRMIEKNKLRTNTQICLSDTCHRDSRVISSRPFSRSSVISFHAQ